MTKDPQPPPHSFHLYQIGLPAYVVPARPLLWIPHSDLRHLFISSEQRDAQLCVLMYNWGFIRDEQKFEIQRTK